MTIIHGRQVSLLGAYLVRGATPAEDVFYYVTDETDYYIMVPANRHLRASRVHRPFEDRADWIAVGPYGDMDHDFALTPQAAAEHTRRIIKSWQYEVAYEKREKARYERLVREVGPYSAPEVSDAEAKLARIRAVLAE